MPQKNSHTAPAFLAPTSLRQRDLLVPTVVTVMVLEGLLMFFIAWLAMDLPTYQVILLDMLLLGLLTYIALRLFVIPKLNNLRQDYNREVNNLLATIDQHCIFSVADGHGDIVHANQKFQDISGYTLSELLGQQHSIVNSSQFSVDDWKQFYGTLHKGKVWQGNIRNLDKAGNYYWVYTTVYPVFNNGRLTAYYSLRSNVTDIVKRAEQSAAMLNEVQLAERRISDFTNHIVHELRTPIHIITNFNSILFEQMQQSKNIAMLKESQGVLDHMKELVNELLDLAKIKQGKMEFVNEPFDLHNLLERVATELQASMQDDSVVVQCEIADDVPQHIESDRSRIRQMIYNLTSNAKKFTERGSIILSAQLMADHPQTLAIAVADTGSGISPENQRHLFSEFFQVQGKQTIRGTGLGLTISQRIARLMGGDILCESELGVGTTFTIQLPITPSDGKALHASHVEEMVFNEHTLKGYRLVVVDDVATNLMVAAAVLEKYGAKVDTFINPEDAYEFLVLHGATISAVITDMHMPQMDGIELTRLIKALPQHKQLPVFGLSGAFDEGDNIAASKNAGMTASLAKPLEIRQLVGLLIQYASEGRAA